MTSRVIVLLAAIALIGQVWATPTKVVSGAANSAAVAPASDLEKDDLKTAASNGYSDRYSGWGRGYSSGYGVTGYGSLDDRYAGYGGYDSQYGLDGDYSRYGNRGSSGYGGQQGGSYGYGSSTGYGGYGGYGGNGGLNSYYGYNNPNYQGGNHLGYGYYRRPGYGNIYNSGITPSLVTGYRGYSRK